MFNKTTKATIKLLKQDRVELHNIYRIQAFQGLSEQRYIISADINPIYSGLGCMLFVLAPAWKYALVTGRTLVIDWRGNPYTRDNPEKNLFSLLFEPPNLSELGVQLIADDSINNFDFPQPILGPFEPLKHENGTTHQLPSGGTSLHQYYSLLRNFTSLPFPTLLPPLLSFFHLAQNCGPSANEAAMFNFQEAQKLYKCLKPLPQWSHIIEDYAAQYFTSQPVIGLHIRHGNGEGGYRSHFKDREIHDFESFIAVWVKRIKRFARQRFGKTFALFLCTDSDLVVQALAPHFEIFLSRNIWRPPPGDGVDFDVAFQTNRGLESAVNALVDMQLLSKCDAVVMTRWTAFASHVPYILEKPDAIFLNHKQSANLES